MINLGSGVDAELQFGLLAVVHGESLHQQGGEPRAGAATEGVEDEEALEAGALVSDLPNPVKNKVNDLLADGVMSPGVVIGRILFARDHLNKRKLTALETVKIETDYLLWVEEFLVGSVPDLIHHAGLEVHEDGPGHVLSGPGLVEEGGEAVISGAWGISGHGAVRLEPWG